MSGITDRRRRGLRAELARLAFACAKWFLGKPTPRYYDYYASRVPALDVIELALDKVSSGIIEPGEVRDALYRLATEVGNIRREQVLLRLALDDSGILIMPPEERQRIIKLYHIIED